MDIYTQCMIFEEIVQKLPQYFLNIKSQSHVHGFGPGRATVHPDLSNRGASMIGMIRSSTVETSA